MEDTSLLREGRNCWRVAQADRFAFIVDAADYFVAARAAMLQARHSITLIGWDFDARIDLGSPRAPGGDRPQEGVPEDGGPQRLGDFIIWLAARTPSLEIRLLRWDTGAFKAMLRGSTLWWILRWKLHPRITLKLDGAHPFAGSHHQKIITIDDRIAFCGGIDMTSGRWDSRAHLDRDAGRRGPDGRDNPPWHDAASIFDGEAARAIGDLARARWKAATGEDLPPCEAAHDCWPPHLEPDFRASRLAIARTLPKTAQTEPAHEIEAAYLDLIGAAKRVIYAESQYFASRRIARAMAERLIEPDGPEIVIINPHAAEGWLEQKAMDTARARLFEALRRIDSHGRLHIYHPVTEGGTPIYVHAKVLVIDDLHLRVGSSNFNNRSLRLDSECDVILSGEAPGVRERIAALRDDLVAEHLGVAPAEVTARLGVTGSLIATIEGLRGAGRSLVPYAPPDLTGLEQWLADNEILDPNGPEEIFESTRRRGLFTGWDRIRHRFHR